MKKNLNALLLAAEAVASVSAVALAATITIALFILPVALAAGHIRIW